jgi:hypothetical protein
MDACRSSLENTEKMNLILVFSPHAHMELEWNVLGILGKLVKSVVHLSKRKNWKILFFFTQAAQIVIDQFWVFKKFRG